MSRRSNYVRGYEVERRVVQELTAQGYHVVRSAGSHTPVDIVAWNEQEVVFIQVKRCKSPDLLERSIKQGIKDLSLIKLPTNGRAEVWVWCDRMGFFRREVQI